MTSFPTAYFIRNAEYTAGSYVCLYTSVWRTCRNPEHCT